MKDYIAKLKEKPEHVRKRIALGTSIGATGVIAIAWVVTMATTGAFNFGGNASNAVASTQDASPAALTSTNAKSNFSQLAGAVAAATGATTTKPALTVIDGKTTSTFDATQQNPNNGSATVIPF